MSVQKLLNPRSIAIVGASDKVGPGFNAWNALQHVGFEGTVYLVNPTKSELLGRKCYPSLEAAPSSSTQRASIGARGARPAGAPS